MADRPLSPHLQVYRLPLLPLVSILTRVSAIALAAGLVVFAIWLIALGMGEDDYNLVTGALTAPLGIVALIGWTFAFLWHSANGIRHLFWDAGKGFEIQTAERSAYAVIGFSILGTLAVWLWICFGGGLS